MNPRLVDRVRRLLALGDVDKGDDDAGDTIVLRAVREHASQVPPADVAPHFGLDAGQLVEHRRGVGQKLRVSELQGEMPDWPPDIGGQEIEQVLAGRRTN